jgi:hypothetical protein
MLSAKQDGNRADPAAPRASSPSGEAVGKAVNSIQGLQQRLNDYTLEEVADAENRSRNLLVGLLNLQSRVGSFVAIKKSMSVVYEAIEKTRSEDLKLATIDTSGKPIHLHDIIQASNLIKFPGVKKTSHQSGTYTVPSASVSNQIVPPASDRPNSTADVIRARPAVVRRETTESLDEPAFVFDATEIEAASGIPQADFSWDKESEANFDKNIIDELNYDQEIQTRAVQPTSEIITQPDSHISGHEQVEEMPLREEPNTPISTALVPTGGDFDQRLLDDLIKNYGEFFSSSDSPSKIEAQTNIGTAEMGSKHIFTEKPAIESAKNTARTLPLKREGDIDRELKKIIKDYGEYDIYSRQSPINRKFAVIGAFLLLAAVFFGFYFLSSSKSQEASSPPEMAEPVSTTWDEKTSGMRELKRPAKANEAKTLNKSPIVKK